MGLGGAFCRPQQHSIQDPGDVLLHGLCPSLILQLHPKLTASDDAAVTAFASVASVAASDDDSVAADVASNAASNAASSDPCVWLICCNFQQGLSNSSHREQLAGAFIVGPALITWKGVPHANWPD